MKLNLTIAVGPYDRMLALQDGSVVPEGIDVNFLAQPNVGDLFRRQARHAEFDVAEFSMSTYTILHGQGDRRMVAIPVFPSRVFRHAHILVNAHAGIKEPKDLIGKRFGTAEYQQTAAVWQRGFLQHDYGVHPSQVDWYFGMLNEPGRYAERVPVDLPPDLRTNLIREDQCLDQMLESGEIDALMAAGAPRSFLRGSPNVTRLFPDHKAVEAEYYQRTGIFPIMHTVVIKRDIYEKAPWVARSLYDAFEKAKAAAMRRFHGWGPIPFMLPWFEDHVEETEAAMGTDPFAYGLEANRKGLETFLEYELEQGMIHEPIAVDELFAAETR
jgi:4,5-dihydroxyphthalate decarboxylase